MQAAAHLLPGLVWTTHDCALLAARRFTEILLELGFNGGVPIDEAFYNRTISGRHNPDITRDLFPDWPEDRRERFANDKEARFRALAGASTEPLYLMQRNLQTDQKHVSAINERQRLASLMICTPCSMCHTSPHHTSNPDHNPTLSRFHLSLPTQRQC